MPNFLDRILGGGASDRPAPTDPKDVSFWDRTGINDAANARAQGIAENNRKNLAYNALRKTYGDIAGDPASAASLQNTQQASELFPIKKQADQLALDNGLADRQRQASLSGALYAKSVYDKTKDPEAVGGALDQVYRAAPKLFDSPEQFAQLRQEIVADPSHLDGLIESLRDPSKAAQDNTPSAVREYKVFQTLTPEQKQEYLRVKRADPTLKLTDVGGVPTVVKGDAATGGISTQPLSTLDDETGAASATAAATAQGKASGEYAAADLPNSPQKRGRSTLHGTLGGLVQTYLKLDEMGAITNPDRGAMSNIGARLSSSSAGQLLSGAAGKESQSLRERINNSRPLLIQQIRQATGMSSKGMDSNRELEFYLQAATDPAKDIYSNLVAIQVLDDTFGLGGILEQTLPPEVYDRIKSQATTQRLRKPIAIPESQLDKSNGDDDFSHLWK